MNLESNIPASIYAPVSEWGYSTYQQNGPWHGHVDYSVGKYPRKLKKRLKRRALAQSIRYGAWVRTRLIRLAPGNTKAGKAPRYFLDPLSITLKHLSL